ncbi:ferredoxin-thioredoxin reductase catalytic chain, chloroplastic [Dendrobium catenatum]|uniref:ferredoxin-thioredoxin reductase catalytic chain, chloroplastic n=1 Tax=Dendrobium catenatum TaxID=906689 RepID=UPI0009F62C34|nr:ferredoxin-thioredoxin reductase catalytic chain, chloroplastic [Dendrobium catenatum]
MSIQSSFAGVALPLPVAVVPLRRSVSLIRAKVEPSEKTVEIMRKFSEQYARRSETYFCVDKGVTSVVIKGLADHKETLGAPLCPCRHYDDKAAEAAQGFWNCPCVPMRESDRCGGDLSRGQQTTILKYERLFSLVGSWCWSWLEKNMVVLKEIVWGHEKILGRSATVCSFLHLIMILLGGNRA